MYSCTTCCLIGWSGYRRDNTRFFRSLPLLICPRTYEPRYLPLLNLLKASVVINLRWSRDVYKFFCIGTFNTKKRDCSNPRIFPVVRIWNEKQRVLVHSVSDHLLAKAAVRAPSELLTCRRIEGQPSVHIHSSNLHHGRDAQYYPCGM